MIQVAGLQKDYGGRPVLLGVDLDVGRGEVFCLLGPNGAGKTTTIEILEGFRTGSAGKVRVLGLDPSGQPEALRRRIGVVLQECGFPRHLRVGELLDVWRDFYPSPRPLDELLEVVGLQGVTKHPVHRLSGGQRRRLDFALALAGDPELIFLDEPTTGFDPEARRRGWAAIENLRALGKTIVLTTHYLEEAERLADQVAILDRGRIQATGPPRSLARQAGVATRISFELPAAVARGEATLPDGMQLRIEGDRVVCVADDASAVLRRLLDWAAGNDPDRLDDLAVTPARLEDVYLSLLDGHPEAREGDP